MAIGLGDNIRDIREFEKNYKRSYVAGCLGITTRAYANIENNVADITIGRLEEIAKILDCSLFYILNYGKVKEEFYHNVHSINKEGSNFISRETTSQEPAMLKELKKELEQTRKELLKSREEQITLMETLIALQKGIA